MLRCVALQRSAGGSLSFLSYDISEKTGLYVSLYISLNVQGRQRTYRYSLSFHYYEVLTQTHCVMPGYALKSAKDIYRYIYIIYIVSFLGCPGMGNGKLNSIEVGQ